MQAFLEFVARNLVDYPDEVAVAARSAPGKTVYELRVHRSDVGKLVGKNGQTIEAIRALAAAAGSTKGSRIQVEILEEGAEPASSTGSQPPVADSVQAAQDGKDQG